LEREKESRKEHLIDDVELMRLAVQHIGMIMSDVRLLVKYMEVSKHTNVIYALLDLRYQLEKAINFIEKYGGGSNEQKN